MSPERVKATFETCTDCGTTYEVPDGMETVSEAFMNSPPSAHRHTWLMPAGSRAAGVVYPDGPIEPIHECRFGTPVRPR